MTLDPIKNVRLACSLLAVALASGCSKSPDSANTAAQGGPSAGRQLLKVGFQLDWYPAPEHGGEYQALVKNFYRDAGLDVTIVTGGPDSYGIQKVATGRVEIAMGACDDVILAVRRGAPLLIVGAHLEHNPQAVMVHDDSLQSHYGISFSQIPSDYGLARFMADKNFIDQCFITNEPYFAQLNGVKTRALLIADAGYDPYRVIFTSKSFAREHPEAVRAFVACTARGWVDFMNGDASLARARIQAENQSQSPALMDYSMAAMRRYQLVEGDPAKGERACLITPARMTALVQALVGLKMLDAPLPLEEFVSFDFLPPEPGAGKT